MRATLCSSPLGILKTSAEGVDLVFRDDAIGLGHFRPERNHADRKGDLLVMI